MMFEAFNIFGFTFLVLQTLWTAYLLMELFRMKRVWIVTKLVALGLWLSTVIGMILLSALIAELLRRGFISTQSLVLASASNVLYVKLM
jgi:hypothetical protein